MSQDFTALAQHREEMGAALAEARDNVRRCQAHSDRVISGDLRELEHEIELWDRDVGDLARDASEDSPQVLAARAERIKLRLITLHSMVE